MINADPVTQETVEAALEIARACLNSTNTPMPPGEFLSYWVDELVTDGREDRRIGLTISGPPYQGEVILRCQIWFDFVDGWAVADCQITDSRQGMGWEFICNRTSTGTIHVQPVHVFA